MERCGVALSGPRSEPLARSCEHDNKPWSSTEHFLCGASDCAEDIQSEKYPSITTKLFWHNLWF